MTNKQRRTERLEKRLLPRKDCWIINWNTPGKGSVCQKTKKEFTDPHQCDDCDRIKHIMNINWIPPLEIESRT